jgi:hypothetical protein
MMSIVPTTYSAKVASSVVTETHHQIYDSSFPIRSRSVYLYLYSSWLIAIERVDIPKKYQPSSLVVECMLNYWVLNVDSMLCGTRGLR